MLSLAPDAASARAGAALATGRKWSGLGGDDEGRTVWGACQGSGAQPYRTCVDLADLTSRCTCPSRKFPCKHALGLLLLLLAEPELFRMAERPAWVAEWVAGRAERAGRKRERDTAAATDAGEPTDVPADVDPARAAEAGRARRAAARADKIDAGMAELARWLEDLVQGGLSSAPARPAAFWETAAARLVDAQAPGAARLVRQCAAIVASGGDWAERLVGAVARLHLLAEATGRLAALPPLLQADVRATLGWPPSADELAGLEPVADRWRVVGQIVEDEERLRARRTWLVSETTGRHALLLHFAHGTAPFAESVPPIGRALDAALAFHPGSAPLRATIRTRAEPASPGAVGQGGAPLAGHDRVAEAIGAWAHALAANPWTERVLLVLSGVVVTRPRGERWAVRDAAGGLVPIAARFRNGWGLAALAGGHPVGVVGEWDGDELLPLAAGMPDGTLQSLIDPIATRP